MNFRILLLVIGSCLWIDFAWAQSGRVRYREIGVTLDSPGGYDAMPIPHSERTLKLLFVKRDSAAGGSTHLGLYRATLDPAQADPTARFFVEELAVPMPDEVQRIKSLGEFQRTSVPYERGSRRGQVFAYVGEQYAYYLVGEGPGGVFDVESKRWERIADDLRLQPPVRDDRKRSALERKYGRTSWIGKERRIEANLSMVEGWNAFDSEQYIYLVHGDDTQAWKEFDGQLNGVRRFLNEHVLTHRNQAPEDVGVVRLCRDRQEYLDYGGMSWTAGYFSPVEDQLVIYDAGDKAAMLAVLRHESFHQYIYSTLGGISPHIWFDEGYAELMAAARMDQQRVVGFDVLAHHILTLREMLGEEGPGLQPLDVFLRLSQQTFYEDPSSTYAQAWIWLDFLVNSEYGQRSSRGEDFIKTYVGTIRQEWNARLEALRAGTPLQAGVLTEVRELALTQGLKRFDLSDAEPAFLRHAQARIAEPE